MLSPAVLMTIAPCLNIHSNGLFLLLKNIFFSFFLWGRPTTLLLSGKNPLCFHMESYKPLPCSHLSALCLWEQIGVGWKKKIGNGLLNRQVLSSSPCLSPVEVLHLPSYFPLPSTGSSGSISPTDLAPRRSVSARRPPSGGPSQQSLFQLQAWSSNCG